MNISINMPYLGIFGVNVRFAIDTGADRTIIGHWDAMRLSGRYGVDLSRLPTGRRSLGIGGLASPRQTRVTMTIGSVHIDRDLPIIEPVPGRIVGLPSLLGLDVLSHFALIMEDRANRVLLLEPAEAASLPIP